MSKRKIDNNEKNGSPAKLQRRRQILDAARTVFAEKGYHKTSVSEIVSKCGLAQGTFYLYFKNKREVFGALLNEFMRFIYDSFFIPGADEIKTQKDVCARFLDVSNNAAKILKANMDIARIFFVEAAAKDPGFENQVSEFYNALITGTANNLKLWMDRGLLRKADPHIIAHCVVGMIERVIFQHITSSQPLNIKIAIEEIVKFELYGILKNPSEVFEGLIVKD